MTEDDLNDLFAKFGRVDKCEVILDPVSRTSRLVWAACRLLGWWACGLTVCSCSYPQRLWVRHV